MHHVHYLLALNKYTFIFHRIDCVKNFVMNTANKQSIYFHSSIILVISDSGLTRIFYWTLRSVYLADTDEFYLTTCIAIFILSLFVSFYFCSTWYLAVNGGLN